LAGYIQDIYWYCQTGNNYICIRRITNSLLTALRFPSGYNYFPVFMISSFRRAVDEKPRSYGLLRSKLW